jgi:Carboxypeptidase regulatory-like domain
MKRIRQTMRSVLPSILIFVSVAAAQTDSARLVGRIYDASGAVIPGAIVTVTNLSTDREQSASADESGYYRMDGLPPASYRITAKTPGFAEVDIPSLTLIVGQERTVDLKLSVGNLAETLLVSEEALAGVETSSASIAGNVTAREVSNLPLNGRSLSQLYLLAPGASTTSSGTFNSIRFSGRANEQNTVRYDGVQAGSIIGASPGDPTGGSSTDMRLSQSLENVQEFRVETSTYSAEFGRGAGGQVSVITKSGTNAFHGGLFDYLRNDYFDARNYFDKSPKQAPLRLNQFGGSVGGPIIKDKVFFFGSNENLVQRQYLAMNATTLSAAARARAVPSIKPLLAAWPAGNAGPTSNPDLDLYSANLSSTVDDHFSSARIDYAVNSRNQMYMRYNYQVGDSFRPSSAVGSGSITEQTAQNAVVNLTTTVTPSMLNEAKVGINLYKSRSLTQGARTNDLDVGDQTFSIGGAAQSGGIGIINPTGAGSTPITHGSAFTPYEWTFMDNLSWTTGHHSFKTGAEYNPRGMYMDQLGGATWLFDDLNNFLANTPRQVTVTNTLSQPSPFFNGVTGSRQGVQYFVGGFFQDQWRAKSNLTFNLGLRYDYFSPLNEAHDRIVVLNTETGELITNGYAGFTTSKRNFAPRIGIAWSPERLRSKTVFRIGAGYYYGMGQGEDQPQQILNDVIAVQLQSVTTPGLSYPLDRTKVFKNFDPANPIGFTPRAYARGYNLPENVLSYTFSMQQALPSHSVLTVAYVGSQGRNSFQRTITNRITSVGTNPSNGTAIITREFGDKYGEVDVKTSFGNNHYDSLQVALNRQYTRGLSVGLTYTWSHGIGTSGGSNEATTSQNNYRFGGERSDNSGDIRHVFNVASVYELPFGRGQAVNFGGSRFADAFLGGWQLSGNYSYRTGVPVNVTVQRNDVLYLNPTTGIYTTNPVSVGGSPVTTAVINIPGGGSSRGTQRPDLVLGVNPYMDFSSGFWLNPAAFALPKPGTYGNLSRNFLRGPSFGQLNLSISKKWSITERAKTELRAEIYNLPNHPNFSTPTANLGNGGISATGFQPGMPFTRATSSTFGQITSTVGTHVNNGTNRQIQFALRFSF